MPAPVQVGLQVVQISGVATGGILGQNTGVATLYYSTNPSVTGLANCEGVLATGEILNWPEGQDLYLTTGSTAIGYFTYSANGANKSSSLFTGTIDGTVSVDGLVDVTGSDVSALALNNVVLLGTLSFPDIIAAIATTNYSTVVDLTGYSSYIISVELDGIGIPAVLATTRYVTMNVDNFPSRHSPVWMIAKQNGGSIGQFRGPVVNNSLSISGQIVVTAAYVGGAYNLTINIYGSHAPSEVYYESDSSEFNTAMLGNLATQGFLYGGGANITTPRFISSTNKTLQLNARRIGAGNSGFDLRTFIPGFDLTIQSIALLDPGDTFAHTKLANPVTAPLTPLRLAGGGITTYDFSIT